MSDKLESPQYVRLSLAADMTLGFRPGRFWRNARMSCINLLLAYENGCRASCAYCGLGRERKGENRSFIRVPWPMRSVREVTERLQNNAIAERLCLSMVTHPDAARDTIELASHFSQTCHQSISCLLNPTITRREHLQSLRNVGVDKIGIAFDLPTRVLFDRHRGRSVRGPHRWETYWKRFDEAIDIFGPGNVGSHFIVGLGETEQELAQAFQMVKDRGGENHLFSFYPEPGTDLQDVAPPRLDVYRRIQLACFLIDEGLSKSSMFTFDPQNGMILDFGITHEHVDKLIDSGSPFMTRGCRSADGRVACNRPFGNSWPGPGLRNFPFRLNRDDIQRIRRQLAGFEESEETPLLQRGALRLSHAKEDQCSE
jgi:biotin synthase-related radical SAM superfamily protein